jgi:hypothetical protein
MNTTMIQRNNAQLMASSFPVKLYRMLDDASKSDFEDVVSWQPGGKSFKVLQPDRFATDIMQNYFNQTKYKSFQRQLNIYGFRRVHHGPNKGGYAHRFFTKDEPEVSDLITRRASNPKALTSFDAMVRDVLWENSDTKPLKLVDSWLTPSSFFRQLDVSSTCFYRLMN